MPPHVHIPGAIPHGGGGAEARVGQGRGADWRRENAHGPQAPVSAFWRGAAAAAPSKGRGL
eukprot:1449220-Alexandrium_andersonii.AAC.1